MTAPTQVARHVNAAAPAPAEYRGLARDAVRMLVATPTGTTHARFRDLTDHLRDGDLVVVNDSATVNAEIDALIGSEAVVVHIATRLDDGARVVEVRSAPHASRALLDLEAGTSLRVGATEIGLASPYPHAGSSPTGAGNRLWRASISGDLDAELRRRGRPIAYGYLDRRYPLSAYQSVFSRRPGSAEMPSAGRPFTTRLATELVARGVRFAPVTLHTGVSSQEAGEGPQPERFGVSRQTAALVNATRAEGGRVVAVGTTVTRALESAVQGGTVVPAHGWTDRVVTPSEPPEIVGGLITGWHDPEASHLQLVEAVAGPDLTHAAYAEAAERGYLWHEFGDSALLLP
jgi:S-adenosylmethionine:tRNA ribosyltransferase-isomerase